MFSKEKREQWDRRWKYFRHELGCFLKRKKRSEYQRMVEKYRILRINAVIYDSSILD